MKIKDFLDSVTEDSNSNPFKIFAAFTTLKLQDLDSGQEELKEKVENVEKDIISLKNNKTDKQEFDKLKADYMQFKAKLIAYVTIGTVVANLVAWLIHQLLFKS